MIRFNQTWCVGTPLPFGVVGLPDVQVRDVSVKAIEMHLPQYMPVVSHLLGLIPARKYQLVSISSGKVHPGQSTCVDSGWHLDGRMSAENPEHYALVCIGEDGHRTLFCEEFITGQIGHPPASIEERKALFGRLMQRDLCNESGGFEIPSGCPVTYSTFDFHKGRQVHFAGHRVLVRVMSSDNIRPKPFCLR